MSAENDKESIEKTTGPKNLTVYDPDRPAYQVQHLCVYLRELEEQAEAGCKEGTESEG